MEQRLRLFHRDGDSNDTMLTREPPVASTRRDFAKSFEVANFYKALDDVIDKKGGRQAMVNGSQLKPKVLIVDDQPQMRAFLRSALKGLAVDTVEAGDGLEAMTLVETERPDLLLADYQMPNWDGLTLCQELKGRSDIKKPKVILITGETTEPMLLEAVNYGLVDAALTKPIEVHNFLGIVKRLLAAAP